MIKDLLTETVVKLISDDITRAAGNGMEEQIAAIKPAEEADDLTVRVRIECKDKMIVPIYLDRLLRSCAEFIGLSYEDLMGILKTYHEVIDQIADFEEKGEN